MKTYYKKDLKQSYMIIEGGEGEQEDYQIAMLRENKIPGILETDVRYIDGRCHYYYDISGKVSLKTRYEKRRLCNEDMKQFVAALLRTIPMLQKYMLDSNYLLLQPEYIFYEDEDIFFCYYPCCETDAKEEFHKLTEFFVQEVDYKEEEGLHLAYTLHKATMEENYSIEKIMEKLISKEEEEQQDFVDYTSHMESQELEGVMIAEKPDFWEPVKRLLERKWNNRRRYEEEDL